MDKVLQPTEEQVNELHQKFMDGLMSLFEEEKHKYLENAEDTTLVID